MAAASENSNNEGSSKSKKDLMLENQAFGFSLFPILNPEHRSDGDLKLEADEDVGVEERKQPAVDSLDEFKKQAVGVEQILNWLEQDPNCNYGIFCGEVSNNLIVIDADGEGATRIENNIINNPNSNLRPVFLNTLVVTTGGGGKHYYLLLNDKIIKTLGSKKIWGTDKKHTEISILANGHYVVGAGSRHPLNKFYTSNGKRPMPISLKELEEFIRAVAANPDYVIKTYLQQSDSSKESNSRAGNDASSNGASGARPFNVDNDAPEETLNEIYETVKPFYIDGDRDEIIYTLSGFMYKDGDFSCKDCESVITKLGENSGYADENILKSLDVVRRTFSKSELKNIKGKSGLFDVLVGTKDISVIGLDAYKKRASAFNRLVEIIYKHKHKNEPEALREGCIIMEPTHPESKTYMTVYSKDRVWDAITESDRPIRAIKPLHMEWDKSKGEYVEQYGAAIINAIPVPPITRIYDPLFQIEKYRIIFEYVSAGNAIKQKIVGPQTKEELIEYLKKETPFVNKERYAGSALKEIYNFRLDSTV